MHSSAELDHLHTLPPPGYSAVSVQQFLRAGRAAFMFLSETMTSLKRNAMNQLPLDLQLPTILSQPNVAFHLLPLSGGTPKAPSATKASNPKKRSRSQTATSQRQRRTKRSFRQKPCPKHSSRPHQQSTGDFTEATPVLGVQFAPRAFIYARSRGASNPTLFKTIVEVIIVSPIVGHSQENRSAKFLH